jgi:hypothetical protein
MSSFLLNCSELSSPYISGCKPRRRRLILRGPMALKEAFAPEAAAPDFSLHVLTGYLYCPDPKTNSISFRAIHAKNHSHPSVATAMAAR